jgi:hypothetical protein
MRMNLFFGNMFWGILLVLWGASLILRTFNINMPLAKIFFAVVIILFGLQLLFGTKFSFFSGGRSSRHGSSMIRTNSSGEYTFVFSGGTIDLTDIDPDSKDLEITVVFGSADVLLPKHLNFDIEPTSVFGSTDLPKRSEASALGERPIRIESTAVFGRIQYFYREAKAAPIKAEPIFEATEEPKADF